MSGFKLACEDNFFIYSKLEQLRKSLMRSNNEQKANNASRILQALARFPLPIVSGKLAEHLVQGVGPWWASQIDTWLEAKPKKRKASPQPPQKKAFYSPKFGSLEWVCLMCLYRSEEPAAFYDIPYLATKFLSEYSFTDFENTEKALFLLEKNGLGIEEDGKVKITELGAEVAKRVQTECPTVKKSVCAFNPDSWFVPEAAKTDNKGKKIGEFEIVLVVDSAERLENDFGVVLDRLGGRNLLVEKRKLWIGDYQWMMKVGKDEFSMNWVVERKTADDLVHSIIDYRYEEQRVRMKMSGAKCVYLLEGKTPKSSGRISQSTLLNSLISTKINYGFQVKVTAETKETFNWLARVTNTLYKQATGWTISDLANLETFEEFSNRTNPGYEITVKEVFGKQLRGIEKIGEQSTLAILKLYNTPMLLYQAIIEARSKGKRQLGRFLKTFRLENGNLVQKSTRDGLLSLFLG
jgi:ERCC4-type nuclease